MTERSKVEAYTTPADIAERLRELVAETLEVDLADVSHDTPLFEFALPGDSLGLDSFGALTLLTAIAEEYGLEPWWLDGSEDMPPATILEMAELVRAEVMRKGGPSHA